MAICILKMPDQGQKWKYSQFSGVIHAFEYKTALFPSVIRHSNLKKAKINVSSFTIYVTLERQTFGTGGGDRMKEKGKRKEILCVYIHI